MPAPGMGRPMRAAVLALALLAPLAAAAVPVPPALPGLCASAGSGGLEGGFTCAVANPGFESCEGCTSEGGQVPAGWARYAPPGGCDGGNTTWTLREAHTGDASLAIDDRAGYCTGVMSGPILIVPASALRATAWFRGEPGARLSLFVALYGTPADDPYAPIIKLGSRREATAGWSEQATTGEAPPRATTARVWLYVDQEAAGRLYVDDVALAMALPGTPG